MTCSQCGHEPPAGSTFCNGCGARLPVTCTSCGATPPPGSRFCNACGATLAAAPTAPPAVGPAARNLEPPAPRSDARKVVTILFADLAGSTALQERLDPESVRAFMERYYEVMRAAIAARGGTLVKLLGDGVMAAFGVPHVAEDDAMRAVHAGSDMQREFRSLARAHPDIDLRVAINTGEVVVGAVDTDIVGDPVNVAARLQQEAQPGDVVIGETTRRLVAARVTLEPLGSFALRGRAGHVKAYRVVSLERPTGAAAAEFVGRDDELGRLRAVYDAAAATPAARLAVLLGSPGLGKSRLIAEVTRGLGDTATVVTAQCDAAGGATFAPVAKALHELAGGGAGQDLRAAIEAALPATETERTRIAGGIGALLAGSSTSPEETFFVIRRFLTGLAATKPVVLVIDDLHWAEPLLLDLVEHLIQWGGGVPLLVLVGARPELRELRSSLVTTGGVVSDVVTLGGLDAGAAMRLAANVIGASDLPAAVAAKVLSTSEGNPLFVGELVRMLVDEGAIERQGERWVVGANLAAFEMPPTIHALLAARIERLRPEERAVLEHASVVGRHFSRSAVAALLGRNGAELDERLEALRRTELIEPDTGWFLGEPVLRFHHVLIRDAAYRRLLKGTRAALHALLADWIEARVGDNAEHDETIGRHLEQAHQLLRELGPLDQRGRELGERAAIRLAAAGRRALAGDDVPLAANLLGRAIGRLDAEDVARAELALDWSEALLSAGDVGEAKTALAELQRFLSPPGGDSATAEDVHTAQRLSAWHTCFTGQLTVLTAPQGLQAAATAVAAAAQELAALGDSAGEAKAHFVHALALGRLGEVGGCEAALDRALAAARGAGDRRRANTVLAIAPIAALWGPSPVTRASGRCLDVVRVLRITQGAPAVEAVALSCQGVLEALRGRTEAARRMIASARKMVEELGITQRLLEADVSAGLVELLEGDAVAAERDLRGAYEGLRDLGLGIDAARAAALLARALLRQDRVAEAESLSHASELLAGDDLKAAIAWRGVRAEALARRGEHVAAVELATKAVELAAATDALLDHADARLALAAALRAAGRRGEADAEERRARDLWDTKGATLLAERAERAASASPEASRAQQLASSQAPARHRRVRPNFATEETRRSEAAVAARDVQAAEQIHRPDIVIVDHPHGVEYGHEEIVTRVRVMVEESTDVAIPHEPLATLGDFVGLFRLRATAAGSMVYGIPVGATEVAMLLVIDADEQGRSRRMEIFHEDKLGDAVMRLYELYAERQPEGPERTRAEGIARYVHWTGPIDLDRMAAANAPSATIVDHRMLGTWSARNADEQLRHWRLQLDLAPDFAVRCEDVLAVEPHAALFRMTYFGTSRASGGPFENPTLILFLFGTNGLITGTEVFEAEQDAEALARFDAVAGAQAPVPVRRRVRENDATRTGERFVAAVAARDVEALPQLFDEAMHLFHHPSGAEYGQRGMLATWRSAFRAERLDFRHEPLASLGDRLVLSRQMTTVEALREAHLQGFGLTEVDEISMIETNERGRMVHVELFAPDRLGDALVRLYERYGELLAEGPERTRAAAVARAIALWNGPGDLARAAAVYDPSMRLVDHRVFGTWSARGHEEMLRHLRLHLDLAPDFSGRYDDVLAVDVDGFVADMTFFGTGRESGGPFENRAWMVFGFGADGRITVAEVFELEQGAEALACFDALTSGGDTEPSPEPFHNVASRAHRRLFDCFNARDWPGIEALTAPDLLFDERRRMVRNTCGREVWLEQFRIMFDLPASRFTTTLRATRGERLSLHLQGFGGEVQGGGGPLALEDHLMLHEVDRDGRILAIVLFDLEDLDVAYAELDARWAAGEGAAHPAASQWLADYLRFFAARDWRGMATTLFAAEFVGENHRLVSWGTLRGGAGVVSTLQAQIELAPDTWERLDHVRTCEHAVLFEYVWLGTHHGGAFENVWIVLVELDADGRTRRADVWEPEQLDLARARFEELRARAPGRGDALAAIAKPNAAGAAVARWRAAYDLGFERDDWDPMRALCTTDMVFEDRRRLTRLAGDHEMMIASARERARTGARPEVRMIGTAGDRVAIGRTLWSGGPPDGRFEIEYLSLAEVDAAGLIIAMILFDGDDPRAAQREAWARWARVEPAAAAVTTALGEMVDAFNALDSSRYRAQLADDLVVDDYRHTGMGRIEGGDAYLASIEALWKLAPHTRAEGGWHWLAHDRHRAITVVQRTGTLPGGGDFESSYLFLIAVTAGRITHLAFFELDATDTALARFEELRRDPVRIPPNAASRAQDRWSEVCERGEWDALPALYAEDVVLDDRRPLTRVAGGRDALVRNARYMWETSGGRVTRTPLAIAGDRLALELFRWHAREDVPAFEVDIVLLIEVDEQGRFIRIVAFDPANRAAASTELGESWVRLQGGEASSNAEVRVWRAWNAHDRERLLEALPADFYIDDRRRTGVGKIHGAEAWVDSVVAIWELSSDIHVEALYSIAQIDDATLYVCRWAGSYAEGSQFEALFPQISVRRGGILMGMELFELEDLDLAKARFESLATNERKSDVGG